MLDSSVIVLVLLLVAVVLCILDALGLIGGRGLPIAVGCIAGALIFRT